MLKGEAAVWRRSVFAFTWANVEFLRRRNGETVPDACNRMVARGMGFSVIKGRKPGGPLYSVVWNDGRCINHGGHGLKWVYETSLEKGVAFSSENLQDLYYAARRKRRSDIYLKRDSDFLLEVLKNGRHGGYLRSAMAPAASRLPDSG